VNLLFHVDYASPVISGYMFGFCHPPSPGGPHPPSGPAPVGAGLPAESVPVLAQP